MLRGARIAVVVPAFNEAPLIGAMLRTIPSFVDAIFVVDDASSDGTSKAAEAIADPRVTVVRHSKNRGVGAALQTGYALAFEIDCDIVAVMAGDGQMDPGDLARVVAPIVDGRADYVTGDRLSHPDASRCMPRLRFVGNHILTCFTRVTTGLPVRDSQCGFTALSRRAADRLAIDRLWPSYGYPNDLLARIQVANLRFQQVIVKPIYGAERSNLTLWHALVVIPFVILRALLRGVFGRSSRALPETPFPSATETRSSDSI